MADTQIAGMTDSRRWVRLLLAAGVLASMATVADTNDAAGTADLYQLEYIARFLPDEGVAEVRLTVNQDNAALRLLDLVTPSDRYSEIQADGDLQRSGDRTVWQVPSSGGSVSFRAVVDHDRGNGHDARLTQNWVVMRFDDLFPAARARTRRGAQSDASVFLTGPTGWAFTSRYGALREPLGFSNPERRFDRPTGWLVGGLIGVRTDRIADRQITIAGPRGEGLRRLDSLAFLSWTLPTLTEVFPALPDRVFIASARTDMWRGALSGPASLYIHADRPLISENSTSTLLHELVHVATRASDTRTRDWIVEGLAEYYSLEVLRRSGGISQRRFDAAIARLRDWANRENGALKHPSSGPDTARAAVLFADLADEFHAGGISMDSFVRALQSATPANGCAARQIAERLLGHPSTALSDLSGDPDHLGAGSQH